MTEHVLCRVDQLVEGRGRPARAGGAYLAVFLAGGEIFVLENQCVHVGSPIDGGPVIGTRVHCPWHGWAYDLRTGNHLTAFGERDGVNAYPHRIDAAGNVVVTLPDP